MNKEQLTNDVYAAVYGNTADPDNYPAANYPSVYLDLQEGTTFEKKAKLLLYLEFDNGYSALRRDLCSFRASSIPYHTSIIKAIIEAYNVPLVTGGVSLPYSDVDESTLYYEHILTAYSIGMLDNTSLLRPYEGKLYNDAFFYLTFMSNSYSSEPTQSELKDAGNYFNPNNYTPENMGIVRGIEQGVFSHYAKNSFVIPDRKMNLNFSHFYSTSMVEIPEEFYAVKPLGRGWSHTYNSYIIRENDVGTDQVDYYYIIQPNGTVQVFDRNEDEYVTKGIYDEFNESSSTRIYITKKNQVRYKYEKLDGDRNLFYLTEVRDPNGNEINIDYESAEENDSKRIDEIEAPSGKKLTFKYRDNTDLIERITDPIGRKIYFDYSGVTGGWVYQYPVLIEFEDAKSQRTTYSYGINNPTDAHLLKRIELPEGNLIEAEYDDNNNGKLESYTINDNKPIEIDAEFDYTSSSPLTSKVKVPMPDGGTQTFKYSYNENGTLTNYENDTDNVAINYPTSTSSPTPLLPTSINSNGLEIDYKYDNNGNVEEIDVENGKSVKQYEYDNDNNLTRYTDPEGNVTLFSYDSDENLTEIKDAYGNSIYYNYDSHGQLLSVVNQEGITVDYTYEIDGAVATINAPENLTSSFSYDGINRLESKTVGALTSYYDYDKNDNLTSFTNTGGYTTGYDYDKNDNITTITNTKSIVTEFEYNTKDQVVSEKFGNLEKEYRYNDDGSLDRYTKPSNTKIHFDYDDEGRLKETGTITDIDYNSKNLVEDITNDTGRMDFRYDDLNRLERVTTVHGYKVEYDYEKTGLVDEITYPTINSIENEVDYSYDKKNRIWQVLLYGNVGHDGTVLAEYEYHNDDRIKHIDFPNNVRTRYSYDDAGRLNYIDHTNNTTGISFYVSNLILDNRGNIIKSNELLPEIIISGGTFGGNPSGSPSDYSYNDNNHAITIAGISHDVNDDGNTATIGNDTSIIYDVDDRLTSYSDVDNTLTFKYNPYNQRVEVSRNGSTTKYIRDVRTDNVLVALDNNNNPIYYYIYTPNGTLLARMNPLGELQYYHADVRGSTIAITDDNATVLHKYRYDDFGSITKSYEPDNDFNPYRYVGTYGVEYELNDLYYMRARYYKPSVGRFLTEDPIWSTNLYPYADNNPISRVDPMGESSILANEKLSNYFYYIGYGDAVNLLYQESKVWNYAINNPLIAGISTGVVVAVTAEAAMLSLRAVRTIKGTPKVPQNKLNHIFKNPRHALDDLVTKYGSENAAYNAVQKAANQAAKNGGLTPNSLGVLPSGNAGNIINVGGLNVQLIGGRIIDGIVKLSSFSRKIF
tara:strand:+ start:902 stop:4846 length:3945 start_codon:yes stop_codon:yes gene_type:complete